MVRGVILRKGKTLILAIVLVVGCDQAAVEVVKILPEPPLQTSPQKWGIAQERHAVTVAKEPSQEKRSSWVPPGWIPPGGISTRWECIVVHHSATATGCASDFNSAHLQRGWDELGYHFVIGNGSGSGDGQIEVGSRWYKQKHGAHCKTAGNYHNEHGIGICLVGNFDNAHPTAAQLASLRKLVRFLMVKCSIPASQVLGHREAPGTHTHCPGRYVYMDHLRDVLSQYAQASDF